MDAAKKLADKHNLQDLVPLNALSDERFAEVSRKIVVEEVKKGRYLFRKGDRDNESIYLLSGNIILIDGHRKVTGEVEAGTDISRYPIANQQPRTLSARAVTKVVIARIDSGLLDVFLTWDQTSSTEATEISARDNEDWMTQMLQSDAFIKIPPAMIQRLLIKMQSCPARAGEVVIRQDDDGDFFYTIHKGDCVVTRTSEDGEETELARLSSGDCFGEESLVSDAKRNASVRMLSDGMLMRLAKKDFVELLQKPLVRHVGYEEAAGMIDDGAVWLDVRSGGEYENSAFEDSVNIPLAELRGEMPELVYNAKYVICCDTGRRSASAAFILSHKGFEVYVLDGGMNSLTPEPEEDKPSQPVDEPVAGEVPVAAADVIELTAEQGAATEGQIDSVAPAAAVQAHAEPERLAELEALRSEVAGLQRQIDGHAGVEQKLAGSEEALNGLQQEVAHLKEQEALLRDQYAALQEEYDERLQQIGRELQQARETAASLEAQAESVDLEKQLESSRFECTQEDWQLRVSTLEEQLNELTRNHETAVAERDADREQLVLLQAATESASQEQQEVQAARGREVEALQAELESAGQDRERLNTELEGERQRASDLQQSLDDLRVEKQDLEEQASSHVAGEQEASSRLQAELEALGQHTERLDGELEAERQRVADLQQQLDGQLAGHEAETAGMQEHRQQLQTALDAAESEKHDILAQLEALQASQAGDREQLDTSSEQAELARREAAELQQELTTLRDEMRQLETSRDDQLARIEHAGAARQAAEEALQRQQQERDDEHNSLQDELGTLRNTITEQQMQLEKACENASRDDEHAALQDELETLRNTIAEQQMQLEKACENASQDQARLDEEFSARNDTLISRVEQLESQHDGLKQERQQLEEELQRVQAGRDEIRQQLDSEKEQASALQQEVDNLTDRMSSQAAEAEAGISSLNGQLEAEQRRAAEAAQQLEGGASVSEELRAQLAQQEETATQLRGEVESQAQQLEAMQQELTQAVEHSRAVELESEETLRKAWEDLNRKNDAEKEMQGQITRLRKKLEQSSTDLQQVREEARESATQARDMLHAERKERADERAQMAARQRELKEQLVAVAGQHEALQSNREGALAQAEDAARDDERARLKDVLEIHAQAEDQLAAMRLELAQAREETERAVSEERQRSTADLDFARAQKAELDAVAAEQTVRLQSLTDERDDAVSERQSIREQLNSLRAEVEIARGLINANGSGAVEDPVKLRDELEEARRNLDIAIRVRSEAESAHDRALAERKAMQQQLEGVAPDGMPLNIPLLDEQEEGSRVDPSSPGAAGAPVRNGAESGKIGGVAAAVPVLERAPLRSWQWKAAGFAAVAIALLAFVFMPREQEPGSVDAGAVNVETAEPLPNDAGDERAASPARQTKAPATEATRPELAWSVVTTESWPQDDAVKPPVVTKALPSAEPVKQAVIPEFRPQPAPVEAPAATPEITAVVAGRSFTDALRDGGRGPAVVELPGATYMMGGSDASPNFTERPRHAVTLPAFAIGKHEVTFADYDRFARATGRRLPYDEGWGRGTRPVVNLSWMDATAYAAWLSEQTGHTYRLPTEAQWEFAARAGTRTSHWWPKSSEEVPANCFNCGSEWDGKITAAVGSFPANGFGLHDTAGNVQEWMQDCYHGSYQGAPSDGSAWQSTGCTQRVVRGGAYTSPVGSLHSSRRAQFDQEARLDNLGFRVVRIK